MKVELGKIVCMMLDESYKHGCVFYILVALQAVTRYGTQTMGSFYI